MKLFTSNFALRGSHPSAVSISRRAPEWYKGREHGLLAPTWELIMSHKRGLIDERGYTEQYLDLLCKKRDLNPSEVVEVLGDGAIMLCYEKAGDFCHRHIVAGWLKSCTGVEIVEIGRDRPSPPAVLVDELFTF